MVFGEVSLKAHPLTQAIEGKTPSDEELIAIADTDLNLIRQATSGGGPSLEMMSEMQDHILLTLLPSPLKEGNMHMHTAGEKDAGATAAAANGMAGAKSSTGHNSSNKNNRPGSSSKRSSLGAPPDAAAGAAAAGGAGRAEAKYIDGDAGAEQTKTKTSPSEHK